MSVTTAMHYNYEASREVIQFPGLGWIIAIKDCLSAILYGFGDIVEK